MQVKAVPFSGTLLLLLFFWEGSFPRYWHDSLPCFICISGQISPHGGQHPVWLPQSLLLVFAPCVIPSLGVCPGPLTRYWGIEHSKNEGCPFWDWLWNTVTSILLTPSLPLWLFSLAHCDEASCHVLSQPMEKPMWQGTQRMFQQTALEKLRPSEDNLWDTNSCQQHVCLSPQVTEALVDTLTTACERPRGKGCHSAASGCLSCWNCKLISIVVKTSKF